ncbi:MAG: hypothetical protein KAX37_10900, partial [Opitutaceae bacterium]|nr:hypothetical protein [Opitutaceae bacterium]
VEVHYMTGFQSFPGDMRAAPFTDKVLLAAWAWSRGSAAAPAEGHGGKPLGRGGRCCLHLD